MYMFITPVFVYLYIGFIFQRIYLGIVLTNMYFVLIIRSCKYRKRKKKFGKKTLVRKMKV